MKRRPALPATIALAALFAVGIAATAHAQRRFEGPREELAPSRPAGVPLLAVVALGNQRVTIYDAEGRILRAPISTGRTGYETPAGIYSVIQKNREHYSNLYDDAEMPFMQRITWSGIALHAGQLPGHPASHGCIRMPYGFAENLFELTRMGMRVVIVRDDMGPADIAHPALFKPGPIRPEVAAATPAAAEDAQPMRLGVPETAVGAARAHTWRAIAAAKAAEVEAATRKSEEARRAVVKVAPEAARLTKKLRLMEGARLRAEAQLKVAESALEAASVPEQKEKAEEAKAKAAQRLADAEAQLEALKAEAQPKLDAAAAAREVLKAAEAAKDAAVNEAKLAEVKMRPVSVFISRKTQRLYVRQAFQPVFESPVTIRDPETPIGTTIYTALSYKDDGDDLRWSALAMYPHGGSPEPAEPKSRRSAGQRHAEPAATDTGAAKAALERISIPQEAIDRISEVVSPGSSLIVSDEGLSRETGKGTDFIVLMSGEPQGGIKIRRRVDPYAGPGYGRPYRRSPYGMNPYSWW